MVTFSAGLSAVLFILIISYARVKGLIGSWKQHNLHHFRSKIMMWWLVTHSFNCTNFHFRAKRWDWSYGQRGLVYIHFKKGASKCLFWLISNLSVFLFLALNEAKGNIDLHAWFLTCNVLRSQEITVNQCHDFFAWNIHERNLEMIYNFTIASLIVKWNHRENTSNYWCVIEGKNITIYSRIFIILLWILVFPPVFKLQWYFNIFNMEFGHEAVW